MPSISEKDIISFMPSVAWTLICATNTVIPEWVHEDRAYRISELHKLLAAQDKRAVEWMTELAKESGEDGKPWLAIVESLDRYIWDESIWRKERLESILSLVIYCKDNPDDKEAKRHLEGEIRYWEDRYGQLGFKSFDEWRSHWEYWLGTIEYYESKLFDEDEDSKDGD